jgi:hypothetical protein
VAAQLKVAAVLVPQRAAWRELPQLVQWAAEQGAREIRIEVLAAELDLQQLPEHAADLDRALRIARELQLPCAVEGP